MISARDPRSFVIYLDSRGVSVVAHIQFSKKVRRMALANPDYKRTGFFISAYRRGFSIKGC
jgi:hypothetical protein